MCIRDEIESMSSGTIRDPVEKNFGVRARIRDMCCVCRQTREKIEIFPVLTVHFGTKLFEENKTVKRRRSGRVGTDPTESIQDLFDNWFSTETIDDFKCWNCQQIAQVSRSKQIISLPKIFCVHLNRFIQTEGSNRLGKNGQRVIISTTLDPQKHCASDVDVSSSDNTLLLGNFELSHQESIPSTTVSKGGSRDNSINISTDADDMLPSFQFQQPKTFTHMQSIPQYSLKSIIHHRGRSRERGHYFTHLKNEVDRCWLEYDDQMVHVYNQKEIIEDPGRQSTCYILFYEMT
jgi:uncharacterized UBP type Zn finger protein